MPSEGLVQLSLSQLLVFLGLLLVILIYLFAIRPRQLRHKRAVFSAAQDPGTLRVNAANAKVVYKVMDQNAETLTAVMVWRDDAEVTNADPFTAPASAFAPFDERVFVDRPME